MLQLVLHHAVGIAVAWEKLKGRKNSRKTCNVDIMQHAHELELLRKSLEMRERAEEAIILSRHTKTNCQCLFLFVETSQLNSTGCKMTKQADEHIQNIFPPATDVTYRGNEPPPLCSDGGKAADWIPPLVPLQHCRLAICPNYIAASKLTRRLTGSLAAEEKLRLIINLLIPL